MMTHRPLTCSSGQRDNSCRRSAGQIRPKSSGTSACCRPSLLQPAQLQHPPQPLPLPAAPGSRRSGFVRGSEAGLGLGKNGNGHGQCHVQNLALLLSHPYRSHSHTGWLPAASVSSTWPPSCSWPNVPHPAARLQLQLRLLADQTALLRRHSPLSSCLLPPPCTLR